MDGISGFFVVVLLIIIVFAIRGCMRGFLFVLFSLVSVIVLISLAVRFTPQVTAFFAERTGAADGGAGVSNLLAVLIAGVAAFVVVWLIGRLLKLVNKIPVLGKINRFFGLIAGAAEGLILVWIIMVGIHYFAFFHPDAPIVSAISANGFLSYLYENDPFYNALPVPELPLFPLEMM